MQKSGGAAPGFVLESWTVRDGLPVNSITKVMQSRSGYMWLGTFDGLVRFDGVRFTTFNAGNSDGLPSNRIVNILEARDSALWLLTELDQLVRFRNGKFTHIDQKLGLDGRAVALYEDATGTLWVRTPASVGRVDDGRFIPASHVDGEVRQKLDSAVVDLRLHIAKGKDGRVWRTDGDEIRVDGRLAYRRPAGTGNAMSIPSIAVDHEGSLWFGTTAGGIHQLKTAAFTVYGGQEGIGDNNLYSVTPASSGGVWAGMSSAGLSKVENNRMVTFSSRPILQSSAISIHEDRRGTLWLGATRCRLPEVRCDSPTTPLTGIVHAIHEQADGTMWFGTNTGLFQFRDDKWTAVLGNGAPTSTVRAFLRTADGALWMATYGAGLARFHDGTFNSVTTAHGLPSNLIRALYQDSDGWLWVGTEGMGIARIDPGEWTRPNARGRIVSVRARDGLFDDGIHAILEDDSKRLWMSTNRGIFRVPREDLNAFAEKRQSRVQSIGYTERHGLRNREANGGSQPAAARTPDGLLWFATQDGLAVVDPATVGGNAILPNVVVERVIAGGTVLGDDAGMKVEPHQRDVQFEFTALSLLAPENVRFRYRLVPYDRDWVEAGTRRTAMYTRVPPGRYTFRVTAANGDAAWNENVAAVELSVVPRFFETKTFAGFVIIAALLLAWAGVRWRLARLRAIALDLSRRIDERTQELREREVQLANQNEKLEEQADQLLELDRAKSRFFANVSHELRTPLTLTIGPLEDARAQLAGGETRDVIPRMDMALRNSRRLYRLVNQILDVAKLEAGGTKLRAQRGDLAAFVRGVASAFSAIAERKRISFNIRTDPETIDAWFDQDALEKVLANLLSNALKFTPDDGEILIAVTTDRRDDNREHARVRVADSGPGIPAEHLPHVFDRFYQVDETNTRSQPGTGIGLSLARELAELHGGTIDVESEAGGGATFTLSIPMGRSHLRDDQIVSDPGESAGIASRIEEDFVAAESNPDSNGTPDHQDDITTILIVDDSSDLRAYVRARLEPRYRVVEAADGAAAIRISRAIIPDLVISDVMMPGTDGHALCAALRESAETDFIPVILLTAQAESGQRITGLGLGADDYIVKPFDMRELEARVDNLIATRRRLRDRFSARQAQLLPPTDLMSAGDKTFVDRLRAAIEANLTNPDFGVIELADAVFQDRSHLFRRTREVLGETPSDLLRRLRLERAKALLEDGAGTVAEVAYGAGFNSVSHFCRTFRSAYGVTPSTYRETTQSTR